MVTTTRPLWDKVLLLTTALFVCVAGVVSVVLSLVYHVNPAWFFFAWNSIMLIPLFVRDFRAQLKKPSFIAYLIAWAVIHGLLVATLMRWFSIAAMIPFIAMELTLGYFVADLLFDIRPAAKENQERDKLAD